MKYSKIERVETVKVNRLHQNQTTKDVVLGKKYHALLSGATAKLNSSVFAKLLNPQETENQTQGGVEIVKINNGEIHARYLKGRFEIEPEPTLISDINAEDLNKKFVLIGSIEAIKQTGGPTLFTLFDGSATLTIKGFLSAGARAYPEINEGDIVTTQVQLIEHEGVQEGEILTIKKIEGEAKTEFDARLKKILFDRSRPDKVEFLVSSPILQKLKPKIEEAVVLIKMAIADNRPIVLKHHADTDGYSAAMALQRAILPLILQQHSDERSQWMYYIRTPSKSPYYDYVDANKDLMHSLSDNAKFNQKMPLIVIVDTGSGEEDALPIQKVKLFGCQVVVIDHHVPGKGDPISRLADAHVNPHLVGDDYSYSAGMLCTEISRLINQNAQNVSYIAGLAGIADRIESNEFKQYLQIANQQGYSQEFLEKLSAVIDFEAWNFRFDESRELVDILFGSDRELQAKAVELIYPEIEKRFANQLSISAEHCQIEDINKVKFVSLDISKHANFNTYPPAGKNISALHDQIQKEFPGKPVLSIGYGEDFVTIRSTDQTGFGITSFIDQVKAKYPNTGIDGGGHEHAGSIKCIPSALPQILAEFKAVLAKTR